MKSVSGTILAVLSLLLVSCNGLSCSRIETTAHSNHLDSTEVESKVLEKKEEPTNRNETGENFLADITSPRKFELHGENVDNRGVERESREASIALDKAIRGLQLATIVFNVPDKAEVGDELSIQAKVSLSKDSTYIPSLDSHVLGNLIHARIRVSDSILVTIETSRHSGIEVVSHTPSVQLLSRAEDNVWNWTVVPTTEGKKQLNFKVMAYLNVDGYVTTRTVMTYNKPVQFYSSWPTKVARFVSQRFEWLWASVIVPLWLMYRQYRSRRKNKQMAS